MNELKITKKSNSAKLLELVDKLPFVCDAFFMETGNKMSSSTKISYARELNRFFDYLIDVNYFEKDYSSKHDILVADLALITPSAISKYLTLYLNADYAERTVARIKATLGSFFKYMVVNRYLEYNPVSAAAHIKIHTSSEVVHLTTEEQSILLDAVEQGNTLPKRKQTYHNRYALRDLSIFLLFLDTGIRVSELHGLSVLDVDMDSCSAIVTRKGGNLDTVYFSDDTKQALEDYLYDRSHYENLEQHSPLFVTLGGNRLSVRAIQEVVKKYTASAIPSKHKLSPHKMRSSFAMTYYEETKDLLALQRKLAHKNIQTTTIYAKASDKKMQETRGVASSARNRIKHD